MKFYNILLSMMEVKSQKVYLNQQLLALLHKILSSTFFPKDFIKNDRQFTASNTSKASQLVIEADMSNLLSSSRLYGISTARGSCHIRAFSGSGTPTADIFRGPKTGIIRYWIKLKDFLARSQSIGADKLNMVMFHGYDKFKQILAQSPQSQNER